jgi:hypothetical protein
MGTFSAARHDVSVEGESPRRPREREAARWLSAAGEEQSLASQTYTTLPAPTRGHDPVVPPTRDLNALGVIGLRMSDLHRDNVACCGDCEFLVHYTHAAGGSHAECSQGYMTTLYSTWATHCPNFTLREPLSDLPQEDERSIPDRRFVRLAVLVERRSGRDRRSTALSA